MFLDSKRMNTSEDCLYLNIWVPYCKATPCSSKTVVFFLSGEFFQVTIITASFPAQLLPFWDFQSYQAEFIFNKCVLLYNEAVTSFYYRDTCVVCFCLFHRCHFGEFLFFFCEVHSALHDKTPSGSGSIRIFWKGRSVFFSLL